MFTQLPWENQNIHCPALLHYLLSCGGLEQNLQYFQGTPVICSFLFLRSILLCGCISVCYLPHQLKYLGCFQFGPITDKAINIHK